MRDSPLNNLFIVIGSLLLQRISPNRNSEIKINFFTNFLDFVYISKEFLALPPEEIKVVIVKFLRDLIPLPVKTFFRKRYAANPRGICEESSLFMGFGLLTWLVGPTERLELDVVNKDGVTEKWLSGVKIKECRYLSESGCKAACLHICKDPVQTFFSEDLGMQVWMKPNFDDNSCEMRFGVTPPPKELDEAFRQPCFSACGLDYKKKMHNKCS
jgi:hypothetical protein